MALPLPRSLSPSKVGSFKDCALAFRFSAIDRLPEPPTTATAKGTLVHRALEGLYWHHPRGERSLETGLGELARAWRELTDDPEFAALELPEDEAAVLRDDAEELVRRYFDLEDPDAVDAVGVELTLEADIGGLRLRGIIDRLDRTPHGDLVVVDYKTGRVPREAHEQSSLAGVQFYALLCEQVLGQRPTHVRLLYLRDPVAIEAVPTDQSLRGTRLRTTAIWSAIEQACREEDFRPKPSALCSWCSFKAFCPAFGGDPALARADSAALAQADSAAMAAAG
jgi:putative RecB family exonuclease